MQTLTETTQIFWVSCDQPMPGPFPFLNLRKGPGIEVERGIYILGASTVCVLHKTLDSKVAEKNLVEEKIDIYGMYML